MKKNDIKKIIDTYGVIPQLKYFQTEVFEFNEAVIDYENALKREYSVNLMPYIEHITEEIADMLVMITQFQEHYRINYESLKAVADYKVKRQLDRIEGNNND